MPQRNPTFSDQSSDFAISAVTFIPDEVVEQFLVSLRAGGIDPAIERRKPPVLASVTWLVASSVVVFVASKYFGAIAAEAGKEHYPIIKKALLDLSERLNDLPINWVTASSGKLPEDLPGPLTIAVGPDMRSALRFVFPSDPDQAELALSALFALLENDEKRMRLFDLIESMPSKGAQRWRVVGRYVGQPDEWVIFDPIGGRTWPIRGPHPAEPLDQSGAS